MPYMDEEIAKMLRKERMKEKEKQQQQEIEQEKEKINEEQLAEEMEKGECFLFDRSFRFSQKIIMNKRLKVYIPDKNLEIKYNFQELFVAGENAYSFGLNYALAEDGTPIQPWNTYKKNMQDGMKEVNMKFKWIEEGCVLNQENQLHYMEFLSLTGLGTIHNHMYMADTKYGRLTINLNYLHEEERYWRPLVQVMIKKMEVL